MGEILNQLQLDHTFFVQFAIFAALFFVLSNIYFKPFMKLIHMRHERTEADQKAAETLIAQANAKLEEYKARLSSEKAEARKEYEALLEAARKEESSLLSQAKEQAKKITQEASESAAKQRDQIRKQLEGDIESLAQGISEKLLSRKI